MDAGTERPCRRGTVFSGGQSFVSVFAERYYRRRRSAKTDAEEKGVEIPSETLDKIQWYGDLFKRIANGDDASLIEKERTGEVEDEYYDPSSLKDVYYALGNQFDKYMSSNGVLFAKQDGTLLMPSWDRRHPYFNEGVTDRSAQSSSTEIARQISEALRGTQGDENARYKFVLGPKSAVKEEEPEEEEQSPEESVAESSISVPEELKSGLYPVKEDFYQFVMDKTSDEDTLQQYGMERWGRPFDKREIDYINRAKAAINNPDLLPYVRVRALYDAHKYLNSVRAASDIAVPLSDLEYMTDKNISYKDAWDISRVTSWYNELWKNVSSREELAENLATGCAATWSVGVFQNEQKKAEFRVREKKLLKLIQSPTTSAFETLYLASHLRDLNQDVRECGREFRNRLDEDSKNGTDDARSWFNEKWSDLDYGLGRIENEAEVLRKRAQNAKDTPQTEPEPEPQGAETETTTSAAPKTTLDVLKSLSEMTFDEQSQSIRDWATRFFGNADAHSPMKSVSKIFGSSENSSDDDGVKDSLRRFFLSDAVPLYSKKYLVGAMITHTNSRTGGRPDPDVFDSYENWTQKGSFRDFPATLGHNAREIFMANASNWKTLCTGDDPQWFRMQLGGNSMRNLMNINVQETFSVTQINSRKDDFAAMNSRDSAIDFFSKCDMSFPKGTKKEEKDDIKNACASLMKVAALPTTTDYEAASMVLGIKNAYGEAKYNYRKDSERSFADEFKSSLSQFVPETAIQEIETRYANEPVEQVFDRNIDKLSELAKTARDADAHSLYQDVHAVALEFKKHNNDERCKKAESAARACAAKITSSYPSEGAIRERAVLLLQDYLAKYKEENPEESKPEPAPAEEPPIPEPTPEPEPEPEPTPEPEPEPEPVPQTAEDDESDEIEEQSTEPEETPVEQRGALKGPDGYYPINLDLARQAHENMSFREFNQNQALNFYRDPVRNMRELAEKCKKGLTEAKDRDRIDGLLDSYERKFANWVDRYNRNGASCPSVMVSGAGNFPVRKKERQVRIWNSLMKEQTALQEKYESAIKGTGHGGISSDDNNAVAKLEAKLASLEKFHQNLAEANKYFHKNKKSWEGYQGPLQGAVEQAKKDSWSAKRPLYTTNVTAEIRRLKGRIQELKTKASLDFGVGWNFDGGHVVPNKEENRIEIYHDEKPDRETIDNLKRNGFRWSPKKKAWQRMLNSEGIWAAKSLGYIPKDWRPTKQSTDDKPEPPMSANHPTSR